MRFIKILVIVASLSVCACAHEDARPMASTSSLLSSTSSSSGVYAMNVPAGQTGSTVVRQEDCAQGVNDVLTHLEMLMAQNGQSANQKAPE